MRARQGWGPAACVGMIPLLLANPTLTLLGAEGQATGQEMPAEIFAARPLEVLSWTVLYQRYSVVVTYEEPVWQWRGYVYIRGNDENAPHAQWLKQRRFILPEWFTPEQTPKLDAAALGRLLEAYHAQNPDGARFKVLESRLGLHIVPVQAHNAAGELTPAFSLLEARIRVPTGRRMASEHFKALCSAITAVTGTKVQAGDQWLDQAYAANGWVPPRGAAELLPEAEKERYRFEWGVDWMPAREALLRFIDQSATTLQWALMCQPSGRPADRFCVLNLTALVTKQVQPDGKTVEKAVYFDRRPEPKKGPPLPMPEELR